MEINSITTYLYYINHQMAALKLFSAIAVLAASPGMYFMFNTA